MQQKLRTSIGYLMLYIEITLNRYLIIIQEEDVVGKHYSTLRSKIRHTREPDSNVTEYLCIPCAMLLIVYEDIGFLCVCYGFTRSRLPA